MSCFRVLSNFLPLILILGLGLRLATPASAAPDPWVDTTRVRQGEIQKEQESLPGTGQPQVTPGASTNVVPTQAPKSERPVTAASGLNGFVTKLAFDLGLIRQRDEDAWAALIRVQITPVGGWPRNAELSPEVVYEVLAAARRAATAGHLSVSADGAEAIVRAALTPFRADLQVASVEQPLVAAPEDRAAVASGETLLLYEHAPTWHYGWQSGFLAASGGVIFSHPWKPAWRHRHHLFLPRKSRRYRHGFAPFGVPAARSHDFAGPRHRPSLRGRPATPWGRTPSVSRLPRGPGSLPLGGRRHGGFLRR